MGVDASHKTEGVPHRVGDVHLEQGFQMRYAITKLVESINPPEGGFPAVIRCVWKRLDQSFLPDAPTIGVLKAISGSWQMVG